MSVTLAVGACALVALAPWWSGRSVVARRVTTLGRAPSGAGGLEAVPAEARVEIGVLLALLAAAVRAGASVPRALDAVGRATPGPDGADLRRAGAALALGSSWDAAWAGAPRRLAVVRRALRPAWVHGAAPDQSLRTAADALRQERSAATKTAAGRLGVRLVLPLGACFLPAFVLLGLLPVLISLGSGLLGG